MYLAAVVNLKIVFRFLKAFFIEIVQAINIMMYAFDE